MTEAVAASRRPPRGPSAAKKLTRRQVRVLFGGLTLGLLLAALDQTIVSTALYTIVKDIGGANGLSHISWVITAYLLASTATTPLYGKLSDLFGRKPLYLIAIGVFLVGSTLSGFSQNLGELIAFRAFQGIGGGGLTALTFAIVADVVSPRGRARYQGYFGAVWALATVMGPLIGGFLTDRHSLLGVTGWRWVFFVNVPIGLIALVVTLLVLTMSRRAPRSRRIDYLGASLLVGGVTCLLLLTAWGGSTYPWDSPVIFGLGIAGLALLAVFVLVEPRAEEPILPLNLFRGPTFAFSNAVSFILGLGMFGALVYISLYFQLVKNSSPEGAGVRLLPMMVGAVAASIISGRIVSRTGRYRAFPILGTGLAVIALGLMSTVTVLTSTWTLIGYLVVLGVGLGLTMQILVVAVQNSVPTRDMGTATSAAIFFRMMGGSIGTAAFGAILSVRMSHDLAQVQPLRQLRTSGTPDPEQVIRLAPGAMPQFIDAFVDAMTTVFLTAAAVMAVGWLLTFALREARLRRPRRPGSRPHPDGGPPPRPPAPTPAGS